jgi:hypothetical protein
MRAVAADEPPAREYVVACADEDLVASFFQHLDGAAAADGRAEGFGTRGLTPPRCWPCPPRPFHGTEAVAPPRFVDLVVEKLDAGEMPGWPAMLPHPVSPARQGWGVGCETFEKVASVERIGSRDGQPAQAERKRLERGPGSGACSSTEPSIRQGAAHRRGTGQPVQRRR